MGSTLESLIKPLVKIRLELMYSELLQSNKEYPQLSIETDEHFEKLRKALPEHLQHTVSLYEDAQISLQSVLERSIYLQGVKDALELFDVLQGFRD